MTAPNHGPALPIALTPRSQPKIGGTMIPIPNPMTDHPYTNPIGDVQFSRNSTCSTVQGGSVLPDTTHSSSFESVLIVDPRGIYY